MKCLNVSDLQLYFCFKKLSTETELLFIGCFPRLLLIGKIDFLKIINFNLVGGEVVEGYLHSQNVGGVRPRD